MTKSGT